MYIPYYSELRLEDNFADNGILVVLNKEASLNFRTYAPSDFAETRVSKVTELTKELSTFAKKQYDSRTSQPQNASKTDTTSSNELSRSVDKYRTILYLELAEGDKKNVLATIKQLEERDDVLSAEPNYIGSIFATPNDLRFGEQWGINNASFPNAWNVTTGSSTVMVGVLDTGIDGNHEDLTNRINKSLCRDFTSGTVNVVTNPVDYNGHGTHVAGIIGAQGNNVKGIAGACWDVRLVSLRIWDGQGNGLASDAILAIDYACNQGIQILNMSGGWKEYVAALERIIDIYCHALFVCAAGNSNYDNDISPQKAYPASYSLHNIISVGAITSGNVPRFDSNYGKTSVDLYAPGDNILSTIPGGTYAYLGGTSMAAPYVAGVAALLLTKNKCSPYGLKTLMMNNVDKVSALSNLCVTGGKLNAQKAVNANLFGGGNGTSGDPYQISSSQHLKDIENFSNQNAYYRVTSNITLSGSWMSSIDATHLNILFGTFDGNGKTISNLSITSSAIGYFGLFHETRGVVKNLTLNSVNINKSVSLVGTTDVGAISGFHVGTIDNCTVNGSITVSGPGNSIGGLVGVNIGVIKNSTNNATVTSNSSLNSGYDMGRAGGVAGDCVSGTISYCNNNGAVTGNNMTGGIVGRSYLSTVSHCNTNVESKNVKFSWKSLNVQNSAGGIAGEAHKSIVEYCTFKGMVKYTSPSSTSTSLQPKMGQIIGLYSQTTLTSNIGNGSVDKGALQMVGSFNQALYAAQYGLYGLQQV